MRTVFAAIEGYLRRRGWHAWHVAALTRWGGRNFPPLESLTGVPDPVIDDEAASDRVFNTVQLWKSVLNRRT